MSPVLEGSVITPPMTPSPPSSSTHGNRSGNRPAALFTSRSLHSGYPSPPRTVRKRVSTQRVWNGRPSTAPCITPQCNEMGAGHPGHCPGPMGACSIWTPVAAEDRQNCPTPSRSAPPATLDDVLMEAASPALAWDDQVSLTPRFVKDLYGNGSFVPTSVHNPRMSPQRRPFHRNGIKAARAAQHALPGNGAQHLGPWAWATCDGQYDTGARASPAMGEVTLPSVRHSRGMYGDFADSVPASPAGGSPHMPEVVDYVFSKIQGLLMQFGLGPGPILA